MAKYSNSSDFFIWKQPLKGTEKPCTLASYTLGKRTTNQ